jgi:hypothetical protein
VGGHVVVAQEPSASAHPRRHRRAERAAVEHTGPFLAHHRQNLGEHRVADDVADYERTSVGDVERSQDRVGADLGGGSCGRRRERRTDLEALGRVTHGCGHDLGERPGAERRQAVLEEAERTGHRHRCGSPRGHRVESGGGECRVGESPWELARSVDRHRIGPWCDVDQEAVATRAALLRLDDVQHERRGGGSIHCARAGREQLGAGRRGPRVGRGDRRVHRWAF